MTQQAKTVTEELQAALAALDAMPVPTDLTLCTNIANAINAIERALDMIQATRCGAIAMIDRF